jgi:hypothetical protein
LSSKKINCTKKINVVVEAPDARRSEDNDMFGRMIKKQSWAVEAGTNTIPLDVSNFVSGTYSIQLSCRNLETVTAMFIKQ